MVVVICGLCGAPAVPQFLCKYTREQSKRSKTDGGESRPQHFIPRRPVASEAAALQCRGVFCQHGLDSGLEAHCQESTEGVGADERSFVQDLQDWER